MEQLLAHLIGDYVLQTSHMAKHKLHSLWVAIFHAFVYSLPFLFVTQSLPALAVIFGTHTVIDRYQLASYVAMLKNMAGNPLHWRDYATRTGYSDETPPWMSMWLVIITDNTIHLLANYLAIRYL